MKISSDLFFLLLFGGGFVIIVFGMIVMSRVVRFHVERRGKELPPNWMFGSYRLMNDIPPFSFRAANEAGYGAHYKVLWVLYVFWLLLFAFVIFGWISIDRPPTSK